MVLGCYGVDQDVETTVRTAGASREVCDCARNMRCLPEVESSPERRGPKCDMAPVLADVGDSELEVGRRDGVVVLIWLEEKRGVDVGILVLGAEDDDAGKELYREGMDACGTVGIHESEGAKLESLYLNI